MVLRRLILFAIVCASLTLGGCSTAENVDVDQRAAFESYLKGLKVQYKVQDGVYSYTPNEQREGRESSPEVVRGDSVYFDYVISGFSSSGASGLYYTNMKSLIEQDTILNSQYWLFKPYGVKLGTTPLVSGVERGLVGSRQGDSVLLFLVSDLGYGNTSVGVIPPETPTVWTVKILKVIK